MKLVLCTGGVYKTSETYVNGPFYKWVKRKHEPFTQNPKKNDLKMLRVRRSKVYTYFDNIHFLSLISFVDVQKVSCEQWCYNYFYIYITYLKVITAVWSILDFPNWQDKQ